jgi:predicted amidohydrolase
MKKDGLLAIQNNFWSIQKRVEIKINIAHISNLIGAAIRDSDLEVPIKVVCLSEGSLTGFTDEVFDYDHVTAAKELYIEIPGEETEALGEVCKIHEIYLIAQSKARDLEIGPAGDRFFNMVFIIDPHGNFIHKHRKTTVFHREHSTCPHAIWDRYIELYDEDTVKLLKALFSVCKTDIGNIGTLICMEGRYHEAGRAVAVNPRLFSDPFIPNHG